MWITLECNEDIQILPMGEEEFHDWDNGCECCPKVSLDVLGKMMVTHNSFDGRELLDKAYETPLHTVRQKMPC